MGCNLSTADSMDLKEIFERLSELGSWNRKQSAVKSGRWFSWHGCCREALHEFWSTRLLLQYKYPADNPDAGARSFTQMKGDAGGLRLGLQCCSWSTFFGVQVLRLTHKPSWDYYTKSVEGIKSPSQAITMTISMTDSKWMSCQQLVDLVGVFSDCDEFDKLLKYHALSRRHLTPEQQNETLETLVNQLWFNSLSILCKRSCALSKLSAPPECFAAVLRDGDDADLTLQALLEDWRLLCLAEQSPVAQDIAKDIQTTVSPPMRLTFQCFESGQSAVGRELLLAMVGTMPDTKFIEDLHQQVKTDALANANRKQSPSHIQNVLINSGMFEARGVPHTARLNKAAFKTHWKRAKPLQPGIVFNSRVEKMPSFFSRLMGTKTWASLSEDTLARSSAAWQWLRVFSSKNLKQRNVKLNDSCCEFGKWFSLVSCQSLKILKLQRFSFPHRQGCLGVHCPEARHGVQA